MLVTALARGTKLADVEYEAGDEGAIGAANGPEGRKRQFGVLLAPVAEIPEIVLGKRYGM